MRHLILALSFCFGFISCSNDIGDPIIASQEVPEAVVKGMNRNFPAAIDLRYTELIKAELWKVDFTLNKLANEAVINKDGNLQEWGVKKDNSSFVSIVLQDAIQKYIDANYPNAELLSITDKYDVKTKEKIGQTVYILFEKIKYVLEFDLLGAFISVVAIDNGSGDNFDEWSKWEIKDMASIPENIRKYLDSKHGSFELYSGTGVKGPNDYMAFYITIKIDELLYVYEFDKEANVLSLIEFNLQEGGGTTVGGKYTEDITDASQLTEAIKAYFDKNYAGWSYVKGFKTYNEKREIIEYLLVILVDTEYYYLTFDGKEQFLKVEKGGSNGSSGGDTTVGINNVNEIPDAIQGYLNTNFAGWVYLKGYATFNSSGEKTETLLVIQVTDDYYYVTFDGKDNFTGAKKG